MKTEIIVMLALCVAMAGLCLWLWKRWRFAERIMRTMNVTDTMAWEVAAKQKKEIEYLRSQLRPDKYVVTRTEQLRIQKTEYKTVIHRWDIEDMYIGSIIKRTNVLIQRVLADAKNSIQLIQEELPDGSMEITARLYVAVPE